MILNQKNPAANFIQKASHFFIFIFFLTVLTSNAFAISISLNTTSFTCGTNKLYLSVTAGNPNSNIYYYWSNSQGTTWYGPTTLTNPSTGLPYKTDGSGNAPNTGPFPNSTGMQPCSSSNLPSGEVWYCGSNYKVRVSTNSSNPSSGTWSNTMTYSYNCSCIDTITPTLSNLAPTCSAPNGRVVLNWTNIIGSNGDRVYRCNGTCTPTTQLVVSPTFQTYTDSTLASGATYSYRVRGYVTCRNQYSQYSNTVTVTAPNCAAPTCASLGLTSCTPINSLRCSSSSQTQRCNDVGGGTLCWQNLSTCTAIQTCSGGTCVNQTCATLGKSSCSTLNALQCSGTQPQRCNQQLGAGGPLCWDNLGSACTAIQTCSAGTCVNQTCANLGMSSCSSSGIRQCSGSTPQVCTQQLGAGGPLCWQNQTACSAIQYCSGGNCLAQTCANLGMSSCVTSGAKQCSGSTPQTCTQQLGAGGPLCWQNQTACSAIQYCSGGNCLNQTCASLGKTSCATLNALQCSGTQPQRCNQQIGVGGPLCWDNLGSACTASQSCVAGTCIANSCASLGLSACGTLNTLQCSGTQPQRCNDTGGGILCWQNLGAACTALQTCSAGTCVNQTCASLGKSSCATLNALQCSGTQPQRCNQQLGVGGPLCWDNLGAACTAAQTCVAGTCQANSCVSLGLTSCSTLNALQCSATQPQRCNDIGGGVLCWQNLGAACTPLQTCTAGVCSATTCANLSKFSCLTAGSKQCSGNTPQQCNQQIGVGGPLCWDDLTACVAPQTCLAGVCQNACAAPVWQGATGGWRDTSGSLITNYTPGVPFRVRCDFGIVTDNITTTSTACSPIGRVGSTTAYEFSCPVQASNGTFSTTCQIGLGGSGNSCIATGIPLSISSVPVCGDGIKNQPSEQCDGLDGVGPSQSCTGACLLVALPICGDGICNGAETCATCPAECCGATCTGPNPIYSPWNTAWEDPNIVAGTTLIRSVHFSQLQSTIETLRTDAGLNNPGLPVYNPFNWGGCGFNPAAGQPISAKLVNCLRQALRQVYTTCGQAIPSSINGDVNPNTPIRAQHIEDLRNAVKAAK